jgi:hypothetical protein
VKSLAARDPGNSEAQRAAIEAAIGGALQALQHDATALGQLEL